jgi:hypothetical protein
MIRLIQSGQAKKQISLKKLLLTLFICASAVTWIGISILFADEHDPADDMENTELSFQNATQEQRARNVAIKATLQDEKVMDAVKEAKEDKDFDKARDLFKDAVADYMEQISDMRAEGEGWGVILQEFGVHPRYSGLGHYKNKAKYGAHYPTQYHVKSETKAAQAKSHKKQSLKKLSKSDPALNGKNDDFLKTKLGGENYNGYDKIRGPGLGHRNEKNGGHGHGHGRGNSGGHGRGKK